MEFSTVQWILTNQLSTRGATIRAKWRHDARSNHSVVYPHYCLWRLGTASFPRAAYHPEFIWYIFGQLRYVIEQHVGCNYAISKEHNITQFYVASQV